MKRNGGWVDELEGVGARSLKPVIIVAIWKWRGGPSCGTMRIFALSDLHVEYEENAAWVAGLSQADYQDDLLILAGDVSELRGLLSWCLTALTRRFRKVLFVPGNHELWVNGESQGIDSFRKFTDVCEVAESTGVSLRPLREGGVVIVPLLAWYDYSFGEPTKELKAIWRDYRACRWPQGFTVPDVAAHFAAFNPSAPVFAGEPVITFSHFVPRIDLMPDYIPNRHRVLYPVLGSVELDCQLRKHHPTIHVYGHTHVNRRVTIDGLCYVNNAFGYPSETRIAAKKLVCIHQC